MNKRTATIGLGAFLVADIVLVALALRPPPVNTDLPTGSVGTARPVSTATPSTDAGSAAPKPPATTATTKAPAAAGPVPAQRMIVGLDADNAWRATMGTCDDGGSLVQVTTDGGKTWSKGTSPAEAVARIAPQPNEVVLIYAAGPDCTLAEWVTTDDGATWTGPNAAIGPWARQIDKVTQVSTPNDPAAQPCGTVAVLDLSRASTERAEVLCANGNVLVTNDGGSSWKDSGSAPGALALTNRLEGSVLTTYAAQLTSACAGVQIVRVTQGRAATPVACVETETAPQPGQVGISVAAAAGWLLVGDEVWTSGADMADWTPSA